MQERLSAFQELQQPDLRSASSFRIQLSKFGESGERTSHADPSEAAGFRKIRSSVKGFLSGVMMIVSGQPPLPVNSWQTVT